MRKVKIEWWTTLDRVCIQMRQFPEGSAKFEFWYAHFYKLHQMLMRY